MKPLRVFLIQPFRAPHAQQFREIVFEVCKKSGGMLECFTADTADIADAGPRLQDRIDSYIKNADICVADLTGTINSNALLEVGAAYALNIPVIPVADNELPSDIRGNLYIELHPNKMGAAQVSTKFSRELQSRLQEASHDIGKHFRDQFVAYGYESRRSVDFYSLVRRCERRIDILTTNLGFVVNEPLVSGPEGEKSRTLLQLLAQSLHLKPSGFSMRILALHPESNFTNDRALGLGRDRSAFRNNMKEDLDTVTTFINSNDCVRPVQIKTYDAFPLQMIYFFDDIVVSSVVATTISSRNCVTYTHSLLVKGAKETYERHFENLWGTGTILATSSISGNRIRTWRPEKTDVNKKVNKRRPLLQKKLHVSELRTNNEPANPNGHTKARTKKIGT
jgi:nucleoside 2-deoxyribosyltransferase